MDEVEYEFVPGGDACELCQSLAGTTSSEPIGRPHENCQCSIEVLCPYWYALPGGSSAERYGPGGQCFRMVGEIYVVCWSGEEIGMSLQLDFGCDSPSGDAFWDQFESRVEDAAADLAEGCPDCRAPLVS